MTVDAPSPPDAAPRADVVTIWYQSTESLGPDDLAAMDALLSEEEQVRAARFVFDRDRRDFTAAHALLRRALSHEGATDPRAWRFDVGSHGKPSVVEGQAGSPPLAFNVSHTHGLVACAVARGTNLGVDVERTGRVVSASAIWSRYFAPSEVAMLNAIGEGLSARPFIELWTLKESYIKAIGTGLAHGLSSFAFAFDGPHGMRFLPPPDTTAADWQFLLVEPLAESRLAVAVARGAPPKTWRFVVHDVSPEPRTASRLRASDALPST